MKLYINSANRLIALNFWTISGFPTDYNKIEHQKYLNIYIWTELNYSRRSLNSSSSSSLHDFLISIFLFVWPKSQLSDAWPKIFGNISDELEIIHCIQYISLFNFIWTRSGNVSASFALTVLSIFRPEVCKRVKVRGLHYLKKCLYLTSPFMGFQQLNYRMKLPIYLLRVLIIIWPSDIVPHNWTFSTNSKFQQISIKDA